MCSYQDGYWAATPAEHYSGQAAPDMHARQVLSSSVLTPQTGPVWAMLIEEGTEHQLHLARPCCPETAQQPTPHQVWALETALGSVPALRKSWPCSQAGLWGPCKLQHSHTITSIHSAWVRWELIYICKEWGWCCTNQPSPHTLFILMYTVCRFTSPLLQVSI